MSAHTQPKQILKKGISYKEYSLLEEWAPQTLSEYHCSEGLPSAAQAQLEGAFTEVQNPIPRRSKNRSSSLYEEWKAQASRSATTSVSIPVPAKAGGSQDTGTENVDPADGGVLGDSGALCTQTGEITERVQVGLPVQAHVPENAQTNVATNRSASKPNDHRPATISCNKKQAKTTEAKNLADVRAASRSEIGGYTAPNGSHLPKDELLKLSDGVKTSNSDKVYFRPSFLEDPWKGLKAIKMECTSRYWSTQGSLQL
ncbi:uncharacterized protein ATNIH1004_007803 [Aspergillus tanneri]|uniref:Uncharacterized protein n=1 Tax=Aspergillus tanneri TaxID=1220188 RepID=A0A5M9MN56_9EURO|nr:uncharacterized protein ATNIH1004_007803 [Aspergillus tanneri]KAA8646373.1 hypothetical protein ATNIH1004_007803 [Aspergillus tanneri]